MTTEEVKDEEVEARAVIQNDTLAADCDHVHADVDDVLEVGGRMFVEGILSKRDCGEVFTDLSTITCGDRKRNEENVKSASGKRKTKISVFLWYSNLLIFF